MKYISYIYVFIASIVGRREKNNNNKQRAFEGFISNNNEYMTLYGVCEFNDYIILYLLLTQFKNQLNMVLKAGKCPAK